MCNLLGGLRNFFTNQTDFTPTGTPPFVRDGLTAGGGRAVSRRSKSGEMVRGIEIDRPSKFSQILPFLASGLSVISSAQPQSRRALRRPSLLRGLAAGAGTLSDIFGQQAQNRLSERELGLREQDLLFRQGLAQRQAQEDPFFQTAELEDEGGGRALFGITRTGQTRRLGGIPSPAPKPERAVSSGFLDIGGGKEQEFQLLESGERRPTFRRQAAGQLPAELPQGAETFSAPTGRGTERVRGLQVPFVRERQEKQPGSLDAAILEARQRGDEKEVNALVNLASRISASRRSDSPEIGRQMELINLRANQAIDEIKLSIPQGLGATPAQIQQIRQINGERVQAIEQLLGGGRKPAAGGNGKPGPTPSPKGRRLDDATAATILQEAGGDKELARQIARQRGFEF